ncbi:GAF domain-containing protein [Luteimonas sp. SX5]|uniref:GAF domain-containing protein n=1 Tax=Luteimonas galliterrae TaxID=2940486 RepID=A0ABT0MJC6_9GAMM|nr:GAF domain-containing protein [Luteimonas galliterrae]MCL1634996.1 GAF domain-containing protein [Luteimonas galliterrae]
MSLTAAAFLAEAQPRLAGLSGELSRAPSPQAVAWALCDFCGRELDLADCVVYLLDPGGACLTQQAAWGPKRAADHVLESRIQLAMGVGIVGRCAQLRLPQRTVDARLDERYVADDQPNLSELAVPILAGDALYGVLDSEHPEADYYRMAHEHAMAAIAERGALRLRQLNAVSAPGA